MNPTAEGMIVDIGAVHEVDAALVESAVPPIPLSSICHQAPRLLQIEDCKGWRYT